MTTEIKAIDGIWILEIGENIDFLSWKSFEGEDGLIVPKKVKREGKFWYQYPVNDQILHLVSNFDSRLDTANGLIDIYQAKCEHKVLVLAFETSTLELLGWTTFDCLTEYKLGEFLNRVAVDFC
jgi:hypothetical protein